MISMVVMALLAVSCDGARILALVPFPGRSHWIVMEPLLQELAARGHKVTVYSPFSQKKPLPNYTDVDLSATLPPLISAFTIDMIKKRMPSPWFTTFFLNELHEHSCTVLQEPAFKNLLNSKDQYDLLITEVFASDCFAYYAHKLKLPLISFTTSMMMPWAAERVGLPDNPSYIPNYLVSFSPDMTLWERTYNTVLLVYAKFWHLWVFSRVTQALTEKSFNEPLPPLHEVVANTSLMFVNSYHVLSQSRPFPPNVIEVGGIHIKEKQPLSEDLQIVLDNAKHGALIMSFGSLVRTSTLPKSMIKMFLNVFAKLPQTIIFKYEDDLPEAPTNVITRKWLSQRDLIEHENVVAVIAHGGLASTIEAVYFGKPLIGIPFYADQRVNIKSVARRGAAIQLDLNDLSEDKIAKAVSEIMFNPKYTENMKQLSLKFRDRPMTALRTAVFWTEYVIRHQGAAHLRPDSINLPIYQYLLLDVIAVLLIFLAAVLTTLYFIVKKTLFAFKRRTKNHKQNKYSKKTN